MAKLYDVSVTTGAYEINGEKKYRSVQIGSVWEGKDGRPFLRLDRTFNPAGVPVKDSTQDNIICNLWEPRQKEAPVQNTPAVQTFFDDQIPF